MPKVKSSRHLGYGGFFPNSEINRRELGYKATLGWENRLKSSLYSSLLPCNSWDPNAEAMPKKFVSHGAVFNLEFSPDG